MLHTLQKLGRIELESRGEYDGLVWSTEDLTDKKGTSRAVEIRIDLDAPVGERVHFGDFFSIEEIDAEWLWNRGGVRFFGGPRTPSHYPGVRTKNAFNLRKSLLGKTPGHDAELLNWMGEDADASLQNAISALRTEDIEKGLARLLAASDKYKEAAIRAVHTGLSLTDRVTFIYISLRGSSLNLPTYKPLAQIGNFLEVFRSRMKVTELSDSLETCHLTGTANAPGEAPGFSGRYNLNKTFVQETVNYANNLDGKNYGNNFRIGSVIEAELDAASELLLSGMTCRIAGVPHVIVPRWIDEADFEKQDLQRFQKLIELTLNLSDIESITAILQDAIEEDNPYWITLLAYDSNGNYFKVTGTIPDVPNFHFLNILRTQRNLIEQLAPLMGKFPFRLNGIYRLIPLLAETPRNEALQLIKSVLERRPIDESVLWRHFTRLALCHRYARYKKHTNVYDPKKADAQETMDRGMLNAVNGYWILRIFLHRLGLLANTTLSDQSSFTLNPSDMNDRDYPKQMQMTKRQEALFHLGRALNHMAHAQAQRNNSKRILQKLNFNGMDRDAIRRLSIDLAENALVYKSKKPKYDTVHDELRYPLSRFEAGFDHNTWNESNEFGRPVGEEEALFYILSGCHFIPAKADADDQDDTPQA